MDIDEKCQISLCEVQRITIQHKHLDKDRDFNWKDLSPGFGWYHLGKILVIGKSQWQTIIDQLENDLGSSRKEGNWKGS